MNKKRQFLKAFNEAMTSVGAEEKSLHHRIKRARRTQAEKSLDDRLKNVTSVIVTNGICSCKTDIEHYLLKVMGLGELTGTNFEYEMCPISFFTGLERIRLRTNKEHHYSFENLFLPVSGNIFR
jgi:hypothetical protein